MVKRGTLSGNLNIVVVSIMFTALVYVPAGLCRMKPNLYDDLSEKKCVKVYVEEIADLSGNASADTAALRKLLEDELAARMTITFEPVRERDQADISIGCDITEFLWREDDPIDNVAGTVGLLVDVVTKAHYARMQAVFTVTDVKNGTPLWRGKMKATITDKNMGSAESVNMLNERIVKIFFRDCLSKPDKP
jgi:hypothetical protein